MGGLSPKSEKYNRDDNGKNKNNENHTKRGNNQNDSSHAEHRSAKTYDWQATRALDCDWSNSKSRKNNKSDSKHEYHCIQSHTNKIQA
jgi:hypothetical protein